MREVEGDLFELGRDAVTVITTNSIVKRNGECVMGRGVAQQARDNFHGIAKMLGDAITKYGNHVSLLPYPIEAYMIAETRMFVSFPVKTHWRDKADLELIKRSCGELQLLAYQVGWTEVYLPRPGCGNGQLDWEDVRPILAGVLDNKFTVVQN